MARREIVDPEVERGRKILAEMDKLEERRRLPRYGGTLPWILVIALVLAIVVVVLTNRERFALIWGHLVRPDSVPGLGR